MTGGTRIIAESALWLATKDTSAAAVKIDNTDEAIEHIQAAMEALERARRALRGW